jgi:three-Cys-motif partner protein
MSAFELPPPADDGLFIPDVGIWSRDKHHFLRRYLHAFTEAMKRKRWDGLHYVDLFAGAGIERLIDIDKKPAGLDWGSPLIAAQIPFSFHGLHIAEGDKDRYAALSARLARFQAHSWSNLTHGNANAVVKEIIAHIPPRALSVAFLDPYGFNLHFDTIRQLASRPMDLIIYFPDRVDALRNWGRYEAEESSLLDLALGGIDWRTAKKNAAPDRWVDVLTDLYLRQLRTLGYVEFEQERIRAGSQPLYKLIFCSKHAAGGKIWRGVSKRNSQGQGKMF